MKKITLSTLSLLLSMAMYAQQTRQIYLSGTDKDHTREWQFYCSDGMNSGQWTTIQVPSCWEQQGFGFYNYGEDEKHHTEQGRYRYTFTADKAWKDSHVMLRFEGVMTDAEVFVNGQSAGPRHQGAFYPFTYEITNLLKYDQDNLLEVTVYKESSNDRVNYAERNADYWIFGGIFRPVLLQIQPQQYIERVAIDARHDGRFSMQAYVNQPELQGASVEMTIRTLSGKQFGPVFKGSGIGPDGSITLAGKVDNPSMWTAETPNLYEAVFKLRKGRRTVHEYRQRFGFRTIELRQGDGFYVNNQKVRMRGVCRHTFWPETGRTISPELAKEDVRLIKEMNMNAVRMSHYPPDTYFLDMCDSLGLYVLDELAGWGDGSWYDVPTAHRLIADMVCRDVNHPSILMWDNGNEGGFNKDVRQDYAIYDPQHRHIIEPYSQLNGVDTKHYPTYNRALKSLEKGDFVYMPTESLHGVYDGGHGAGLDDYWQMILSHPLAAGQFLWDFADEGVVRRDLHDSIDCHGLYAPDGILGPHHEKEGSFYTIKQVWCPVQPSVPDYEAGRIQVENRFDFTNLSQCSFTWKMLRYPDPLDVRVDSIDGTIAAPNVAPHASGELSFQAPSDWRNYDVFSLTAQDPFGKELFTWRWNITSTQSMAERVCQEARTITQQQAEQLMNRLQPRIVGLPMPQDTKTSWTLLPNGVIRVDYSFTLDGDYKYAGIGFSCPEEGMKGATLMANGSYRVWKNRLKGPVFGVYDKPYNNTVTGQDWIYPEFKGYYSNFHAIRINGGSCDGLILATDCPDQYLQLLHPATAVNYRKQVDPPFPDADLSVLLTIPGIGNKFAEVEEEGPQGLPRHYDRQTYNGKVYLMMR